MWADKSSQLRVPVKHTGTTTRATSCVLATAEFDSERNHALAARNQELTAPPGRSAAREGLLPAYAESSPLALPLWLDVDKAHLLKERRIAFCNTVRHTYTENLHHC